MQNVDAIVVFALVGMIAINFSRNMAVVMFVCLTTVHLLMPNFKLVNKVVHEGMKSMGKDTTTDTTTDDTTTDTTTDDTTSMTDEDKKKMMMMKKMSGSSTSGTSTSGSTKPSTTTNESSTTSGFRPMEEKEGRDKLNYGASIHNAYQDLNSILDGDAIKSLTSETMALMEEQKKLADSLNQMGPFMEQAQNLLSNFNNKKQ